MTELWGVGVAMMSAHVKGTGTLAYPEQDPRELRARAVRETFERIHSAQHGLHLVWSRYAVAVIHGAGSREYQTVRDTEARLDRVLREAEGAVLQALNEAEVPAIHDRQKEGD